MPSFTRSLMRRNRSTRRTLHVESLERREVLAGNVTAQLVGSALLITGDSLGNAVVVASVAGGGMAVLGIDTTINGSVNPFVTNKPVVSIIANLNGGDDGIGFGNSAQGFADQLEEIGITPAPFDIKDLQDAIDAVAPGAMRFVLPGSLAITTAGGTDFVAILGSVGGSVAANLGPAPTGLMSGNALVIGGFEPEYASRIGGALSIVGGAQRDLVELMETTVTGGVATNLGGGENGLLLYASSIGSLAYSGGAGDDYVDAEDLRVRYGVSVATGAGDDEVYLHDFEGSRTIVGGSISVNTGAGSDYVEISSAVSGSLAVVTGQGDDEVQIYETAVGVNAVIDTGGGEDGVSIELMQVRYALFVYLGAGNDELDITATTALAASLYGGPGTNALAIDVASRAGIGRLVFAQFQTVT